MEKKSNNIRDKIEKVLIEICIKIAKQGKGCLFVIKEKEVKYQLLIEQDLKSFDIFKNQRRLELLAMQDGACIVSLDGKLIAYSAKIEDTRAFKGYGTRHSAAYSASLKGNTAILASEEDRKVRIFRNGKLVIEIDALEKKINTKTNDIVNILESVGAGTLGTVGTSLIAPTLGLTLIKGVIIFGSTYFLIKLLNKKR